MELLKGRGRTSPCSRARVLRTTPTTWSYLLQPCVSAGTHAHTANPFPPVLECLRRCGVQEVAVGELRCGVQRHTAALHRHALVHRKVVPAPQRVTREYRETRECSKG
jgi:hypothetical protein